MELPRALRSIGGQCSDQTLDETLPGTATPSPPKRARKSTLCSRTALKMPFGHIRVSATAAPSRPCLLAGRDNKVPWYVRAAVRNVAVKGGQRCPKASGFGWAGLPLAPHPRVLRPVLLPSLASTQSGQESVMTTAARPSPPCSVPAVNQSQCFKNVGETCPSVSRPAPTFLAGSKMLELSRDPKR
jgi:hypothetical protein